MNDYLWGMLLGASIVVIGVLTTWAAINTHNEEQALEQRLLNLEQAIQQREEKQND